MLLGSYQLSNQKVKIGFVLKGYPRVSETFIAQEIYLLEQMGFDIEIFSMRKAREKERQPIVAMIKAQVTYIPEYIFEDYKEFLKSGFELLKAVPFKYIRLLFGSILESIKKFDDDPVKRFLQASWLVNRHHLHLNSRTVGHLHSHFIHAPTELTQYAAKLSDLKYSISAHAKDIYTIPESEVVKRVNASEFIMTCTKFNVNFLKSLKGIQTEKVHQIYHGVDLETFKPLADKNLNVLPRNAFVSVGRLVPKKGYEIILNALAKLKNQGIQFTYDVYGEGELREQLIELTNNLNLSSEVKFHRTATHPQIIARLQQGGTFLSGSKQTADLDRDGIPNTIAEAMAIEVPVIASNVSGIPELIENKKTGLLFAEGSVDELIKCLNLSIANPDLMEELGKAGRKKVTEVFNSKVWIQSCAKLLSPYAKV